MYLIISIIYPSLLAKHASGPPIRLAAGRVPLALDGDPHDLHLRLFSLRQGNGQNAVPKAGINLGLIDFDADQDAALETTVVELGELTILFRECCYQGKLGRILVPAATPAMVNGRKGYDIIASPSAARIEASTGFP